MKGYGPRSPSKSNSSSLELANAYNEVDDIIQSLSSREHYLKIYPYAKDMSKINISKVPNILVYEHDEQLTLRNLIWKYAKEINREDQAIDMDFYLSNGHLLDNLQTIKMLKKYLRVNNINGLQVYLRVWNTPFRDQCAVSTMNDISYNKNAIEVPFVLPDTNYTIYLPIEGDSNQSFASVVSKLSAEIQRSFGKAVNPKLIRLMIKQGYNYVVNEKINFKFLSKEDRIQVIFTDNFKLPALIRQNNSCLIIKGEGIQPVKLFYDDIKDKKVKDVLQQIQTRPNWSEYGIKIGDFVIKTEEKFYKANHLLKSLTGHCKTLAAVVIKQFHIFQAEKKKIKDMGSFKIEQIVDKDQNNLKLREDCQNRIKERALAINTFQFKENLKFVQPILLYTSELYVKPSNKGSSKALYRTLNTFLRDQQFGLTTEDHYKQKWQYPFTNELIEQLKKIKPLTNCVFWRGVSYLPSHKEGDKILYKQFTSTSTNQKQAKYFAGKALFKITKSHSGKPIDQFSYFQTENQVLFQPYAQFQVKKISIVTNQLKNNIKIPLIELEELEKPPMPNSNGFFLLWVDDKIQQSKQIWESLSDVKHSTAMIPLLTTQQLKIWLQKNKELLSDETAQFVMVTNMIRYEKGVRKDEAGVEAIRQFRKAMPDSYMFVYVAYVEGALQKLKKNSIKIDKKLQISDDPKIMDKFLQQIGGLK